MNRDLARELAGSFIRRALGSFCIGFQLVQLCAAEVNLDDQYRVGELQKQFEVDLGQWYAATVNAEHSKEALTGLAVSLHDRWTESPNRYSERMLLNLSMHLLRHSSSNHSALRLATAYTDEMFQMIPRLGLVEADDIIQFLNRPLLPGAPSGSTLGEIANREIVLNGILSHIAAVSQFITANDPQATMQRLPVRPRVPDGVSHMNNVPTGPITDPALKAQYEANIRAWEESSRTQNLRSKFTDAGGDRWPELQEDIAKFIHSRFSTMLPEDVDILERAFDKHIKNPELKEKLILRAFKGVNPFLNRAGLGVADRSSGTPKRSVPFAERFKSATAKSPDRKMVQPGTVAPDARTTSTGAQAAAVPPSPMPLVVLVSTVCAAGVLWLLLRRRGKGSG